MFDRTCKKRPHKGNSLLECPDSYIVLDLETTGLDPKRDAIIEVSALKVKDGIIQETYSTLVNPNCEIPSFITCLTSITDDMVADKPTIEVILPQIMAFVENSIIVGHNINFDINFLYDNLEREGHDALRNNFVDTMRIARRILDLPNYKLTTVAQCLNVAEMPMHRAEQDCISVMLCYEKMKNFVRENNICLDYVPCCNRTNSRPRRKISEIEAESNNFDIEHPLYGKVVVFTGTMEIVRDEAAQLAVNKGAICKTSVTKDTNYLVLGDLSYTPSLKGAKSSKLIKAEQYIIDGLDMSIISESVFMDMVRE